MSKVKRIRLTMDFYDEDENKLHKSEIGTILADSNNELIASLHLLNLMSKHILDKHRHKEKIVLEKEDIYGLMYHLKSA